jgi:predicted kinase
LAVAFKNAAIGGRRVSQPSSKVWPGLVIVEGIMGSGKSTAVLGLADRLKASGISALGITEGVQPHPIRFDWDLPWASVPAAKIADASVKRWMDFAGRAASSGTISVVDGQLFHGNLTSLFLLEADMDLMRGYVNSIAATIAPLQPFLIYFHQDDVDQAIRAIATERGDAWVQYQVEWKLGSPYALRRGLKGIDGLVDLYRDYRRLTDELYAGLDIRKISIENSSREWSRYDTIIDRCLARPEVFRP